MIHRRIQSAISFSEIKSGIGNIITGGRTLESIKDPALRSATRDLQRAGTFKLATRVLRTIIGRAFFGRR